MKGMKVFGLGIIIWMLIIPMVFAGGGSQTTETSGGKKSFSILNAAYDRALPPPDVDINNNQWADIFKKEMPDIEINWIIVPPGTMNERVNILIGSGEMPDVFPMYMTQMIQWSDMGIIQNIDGMYQSSYKNIYNFLIEDDLLPTKYNGHQYGIMLPANHLQNPYVMCIRADWLDNLGLSMPKTIDELYNVLYAFTFNDPDGNGIDDTYGLGGTRNFGNMWQIFSAFGVQNGNFTLAGNQIIPDFIRPEMRDAVAFLAKLYNDSILDKDTMVMAGGQLEDKGVRGIVGLFGLASNGIAVRVIPNSQIANPNARFELFDPPASPDGNIHVPIGRNGGEMRGVSAKSQSVDAIMYFFNWMIEQDMSTLPFYTLNADKIYNGTLGVHTVPLGDKFILEMDQSLLSRQATYDLWRYGYRTHYGTMQVVSDALQLEISRERVAAGMIHPFFLNAQEQAVKYGYTSAVAVTGPVYAEYMPDINTYWAETMATIINGSKPISAFDDFVRFFYANNGQRIIDEVTALNK